jgi:hypothetical protein
MSNWPWLGEERCWLGVGIRRLSYDIVDDPALWFILEASIMPVPISIPPQRLCHWLSWSTVVKEKMDAFATYEHNINR